MELVKEGSKEENELIPDETKEGMFAFLKEIILVFEALNVVMMQVVKHILWRTHTPLELLSLFAFLLP